MEDALGEMDGGSTFRICISLFTTICPSPAPDRSDGPRSDRQADRSCSLYTDVLRRHNLATFVHYGSQVSPVLSHKSALVHSVCLAPFHFALSFSKSRALVIVSLAISSPNRSASKTNLHE